MDAFKKYFNIIGEETQKEIKFLILVVLALLLAFFVYWLSVTFADAVISFLFGG